jgi:hypothetical protein
MDDEVAVARMTWSMEVKQHLTISLRISQSMAITSRAQTVSATMAHMFARSQPFLEKIPGMIRRTRYPMVSKGHASF